MPRRRWITAPIAWFLLVCTALTCPLDHIFADSAPSSAEQLPSKPSSQDACPSTPQAQLEVSPYAAATGKPHDFTFRIDVPLEHARRSPMVEIVPLDERCGVIGPPVALARDSGQPSDGDLIAGDAVYSARITRTYAAATTVHFGARIPTATSILSNKVSLIFSAPISFETLAAQAQLLDAAGVVWQSKLTQLGRTREARLAAVEEIRKLPGVVSVDISGMNDDVISIEGPPGQRSMMLTRGPEYD